MAGEGKVFSSSVVAATNARNLSVRDASRRAWKTTQTSPRPRAETESMHGGWKLGLVSADVLIAHTRRGAPFSQVQGAKASEVCVRACECVRLRTALRRRRRRVLVPLSPLPVLLCGGLFAQRSEASEPAGIKRVLCSVHSSSRHTRQLKMPKLNCTECLRRLISRRTQTTGQQMHSNKPNPAT